MPFDFDRPGNSGWGPKHQGRGGANRHNPYAKGKNNNKKNKPHALDMPFYCEICVVGYKSKDDLDNHLKDHVKCTHEGCSFIGSPKITAKHIMNVHEMLKSLGSSEVQDQRWREQRRKAFPTKVNQTSKQQQIEHKIESGQVLVSHKNQGQYRFTKLKNDVEWAKDEEPIESEKMKEILAKADKLEKLEFPADQNWAQKSLIKKLLHDEILAERNEILKTIRFVVRNKFFDS